MIPSFARVRTRRAVRAGLALLAAVAVLAVGTPSEAVTDETTRTYLVRADDRALDALVGRVEALGAEVLQALDAVDTLVVEASATEAHAVASVPGVRSVVADSSLQLASAGYDPAKDPNSLASIGAVLGIRGARPSFTGRGIDIALLDSGVTRVAGLHRPGQVINGPDLSFESQNPNLRYLDTYGHGTHLAGIIAGDDGAGFSGIAPGARIVNLKLADAQGATDVSQVVAAIDWVVQYGRTGGLNVRVLNLAFATPALQPYQMDPLSHAAEVAWRAGIVVVVAAGNAGASAGMLGNPAQNPHLLAVAALDTNGTRATLDDTVPAFSSRGDGVRNPDLAAPGVHVPSLRVPGSRIDLLHGDGPGAVTPQLLRGSGTSQAAAVVSGVVALLLQQRPGMSPDQVKQLLVSTAQPVPGAGPKSVGRGLLDYRRAMRAPTPPNSPGSWARSTGTGSLELARGGMHLSLDGAALTGEQDIFGAAFDAASHAAQAEAHAAWSQGRWNGSAWTGITWAGDSWAGITWAGGAWTGITWAGITWAEGYWNGITWAGQSWAPDEESPEPEEPEPEESAPEKLAPEESARTAFAPDALTPTIAGGSDETSEVTISGPTVMPDAADDEHWAVAAWQ